MKTFNTPKKSREIIEFELDGEIYHFTPQKVSLVTLPLVISEEDSVIASLRAQLNWLGDGLPDNESQRIIDRLQNPNDDLDIDDLGKVFEFLLEKATGNPTG